MTSNTERIVRLPDPRGSLKAFTRLALSQASRELADAAVTFVPTFGEEGAAAGSYSSVVRHIGVLAKRVRVLGVLCDRIVLGASWETIGHYLGMDGVTAEELFTDMQRRWLEGDMAPWAPLATAVDGIDLPTHPIRIDPDARRTAESLDRYCQAYLPRDPHGVGTANLARAVAKPVSGHLPE